MLIVATVSVVSRISARFVCLLQCELINIHIIQIFTTNLDEYLTRRLTRVVLFGLLLFVDSRRERELNG